MCTAKEKSAINYLNRTLIALAGAGSTLADGFHGGDLLCMGSMLFWLLEPECTALEEKLLDRVRNRVVAEPKAELLAAPRS